VEADLAGSRSDLLPLPVTRALFRFDDATVT